MAIVPLPQPPDKEIVFVHSDVAMYCENCRAISNTSGDCPSCAGSRSNLRPLSGWLDRNPGEGVVISVSDGPEAV